MDEEDIPIARTGLLFYLCRKPDSDDLELKNIVYQLDSLPLLQMAIDDIESRGYVRWVDSNTLLILEIMGIRFRREIMLKQIIKRHKLQ